ncbi:ribonuclease HIII [Calidifontibacillus erzurumensis]|uniref:ribonuclease HIII n=1 Tax=Calidifontibacillus erzurumensis TaxID=2741433 RepID=UPI0035B50D50
MSNAVITVSNHKLTEMKKYYDSIGAIIDAKPQGSIFVAKTNGCTITAYKSGKVLFQGKNAQEEVAQWNNSEADNQLFSGKADTSSTKKKSSITKALEKNLLPYNLSEMSIIGSDEVGTGDYFGPITVAAAYVAGDQIKRLQELGVKDSKDLTDSQIVKIAEQIIPIVPHSLLILRNEKYNELEQKGMNQGKIKALLHNQAISKVIDRVSGDSQIDGILIDQFCQPDVFFRYLNGKEIPWKTKNYYFSTKAERIHIAVAAASIIARYAFVKEFEKLNSLAGFELPKGAGEIVDKKAAEFIERFGEEALVKVAKLHFANTEKAKQLLNKR